MHAPALSEMISAAKVVYPDYKDDMKLERLAQMIQNASIGLSMVLAPIFGAFVTAAVGFRMTTDIMVLVLCTQAVLYFALADGKTAFRSTCGRSTSKNWEPNDNDFFKMPLEQKTCDESLKIAQSSSGELSPYSPAIEGSESKR